MKSTFNTAQSKISEIMVKTGFAQLVPILMPTVLRMTFTVAFLMIKAEELCMLVVASVLLKSILSDHYSVQPTLNEA
jgi:hypothetical protein